MSLEATGWNANSVDFDQILHSTVSDIDQQYLLKPVLG